MTDDKDTPEGESEWTGERRLAEWHRYYSAKRIGQQWFQVHLLEGLDVRRVLEIGPYLGLVTAMLDNAGYEVTTLDLLPRAFERPARPHIAADLIGLDPGRIRGFDAILCCETLEHLPWDETGRVLAAFHASGARHLIVSVPYQGTQVEWSLYANRHVFRQRFAFKKFRFLRRFTPDADPYGHKWEVGYKGHALKDWEAKIAGAGWRVLRRDFTHPTRSVFHLLERGE